MLRQVKSYIDSNLNPAKVINVINPTKEFYSVTECQRNSRWVRNFQKCLLQELYQAVAQWLSHWIPNPGVPGLKPLGGCKVDSAFHPSKVDEMSTRNSWGLMVKSKLSPHSGSVALRQMNPRLHHMRYGIACTHTHKCLNLLDMLSIAHLKWIWTSWGKLFFTCQDYILRN